MNLISECLRSLESLKFVKCKERKLRPKYPKDHLEESKIWRLRDLWGGLEVRRIEKPKNLKVQIPRFKESKG